MVTIKCEKCKTEMEVTEKEASWMKVCKPCYAQANKKPFVKASEGIKPTVNAPNNREDCIMRQCALKCLAMCGQLYFDDDGKLFKRSKISANDLLEYMKKG